MPASPHLERFSLVEDDVTHDVVAIAFHTLADHELALVVPEAAFDDPSDDMDAWVRTIVEDPRGGRALGDVPDELVDPAWDVFESALSLQMSGEPGAPGASS